MTATMRSTVVAVKCARPRGFVLIWALSVAVVGAAAWLIRLVLL